MVPVRSVDGLGMELAGAWAVGSVKSQDMTPLLGPTER